MHIGEGEITEIYWQAEKAAKIICPPSLIPAPGQYVIGHDGSDAPLPVPIFQAGSFPFGFFAAPPLPPTWRPGTRLKLRGPLGRGFSLPETAHRMALLTFDGEISPLLSLLPLALTANIEVVLMTPGGLAEVPTAVEIQPLHSLGQVLAWADYLAVHVDRDGLPLLREHLSRVNSTGLTAQILVRSPMPCGALAECGVCALPSSNGWKWICKDGPVFDWREIG